MKEVLLKYEGIATRALNKIDVSATMENESFESKTSREKTKIRMSIHSRTLWRNTLKSFLASIPTQKCYNCGSVKRTMKRDGFSKIFLDPLSGKASRLQAKAGFGNNVVSALKKGPKSSENESKETSDNESDDSGTPGTSDSSDEDSEVDEEKVEVEADDIPQSKGRQFWHTLEVREQLAKLWSMERAFVDQVWGRVPSELENLIPAGPVSESNSKQLKVGYNAFFLQTLPVPPSRFRPAQSLAGRVFEHPQTVALQKILTFNQKISEYYAKDGSESKKSDPDVENEKSTIEKVLQDWIAMQEVVNSFLDSSKYNQMDKSPGVRQLLEKKAGLFRQNMMGKRVNYAARSVISPDPYIGTDEVGVPVRFATKLSFPEPVTQFNVEKLAQMVRNGPDVHPGALYVEDVDGRLTDLRKRDKRQREHLARKLSNVHRQRMAEESMIRASMFHGNDPNGLYKKEHNKQFSALSLRKQKKVWRHLESGDMMLANRQPTLHKPSIMAHKVRVINNHAMQTIRLHYANCNTYNADFDGDEINLHFPQTYQARAEAEEIANTNSQYCSGTDGGPLRGLIQDHVDMGVMLTKYNTLLTKAEYVQMVYTACSSMGGNNSSHFHLLPPAILKPKMRWTGKQVISTLLMHLVGSTEPEDMLTMGPGKSKTSAKVNYDPILLAFVLRRDRFGKYTQSRSMRRIQSGQRVSNLLVAWTVS